jgi:hypothetical protein
MPVSQGFLDQLHKLLVISDKPCTCETCKNVTCPSCYATQEVDGLYETVQHVLETIEMDFE